MIRVGSAPRGRLAIASGTLLLAFVATPSQDPADRVEDVPIESELIEEADVELAQFDVTVRGDPTVIASLAPEDFRIKLGLKRLREFRLDRLCPAAEEAGTLPASESTSRAAYLFYFDQPHLTQAGRQRALGLAREIGPRLIARGGRVSVVSNAGRVETFTEHASDPGEVIRALDAMEQDPRQWDPYASFESARVDEVVRDLDDRLGIGVELAISTARRHQRYERWVTEKNLRRLDQVLGRFAAVDPPKAVVYFADTMRSNAGEHYLSFFSLATIQRQVTLSVMQTEAETARLAYDRVLEKAAALGIRFYTIHAQGLALDENILRLSGSQMVLQDDLYDGSTIRIRDAQNSLSSLARETGGEVFLHAPRPERIADRILEDLACVFLVSFEPGSFARDAPIPLKVRVTREGVETIARGQIVIQSDRARRESRLLAAFAAPNGGEDPFDVRETLVPIDYADGRFRALLQVRVPPIAFARTTWDIGATVVPERPQRASEASGRLIIPPPGAPAVFEAEVLVDPGSFHVVAVAHETETDQILSGRTDESWPDPDARPATAGPVAVMQPASAVFVRGSDTRPSGSLGLRREDVVQAGLPTAVVSLACRSKRMGRTIVVERGVYGPFSLEFDRAEIEPGSHRCVQIRDVIPADTLAPGSYVYRMRVRIGGREYDATERPFVVTDVVAEETPPELRDRATDDRGIVDDPVESSEG